MSVHIITNENYKSEVLENEKTVLLDFWASWCGPCKMLSPIVDRFAEANGDVYVGKVNVDEQEELAHSFKVSAIPTLVVLKKGKIVAQNVGLINEGKIAELVK